MAILTTAQSLNILLRSNSKKSEKRRRGDLRCAGVGLFSNDRNTMHREQGVKNEP